MSLSTAYALGDVLSLKHSLHRKPSDAKGFYIVYCGLIVLAAGLVLTPGAPLGLLHVLVDEQGLERRRRWVEAWPFEQGDAGLLKFGRQKAVRIAAGGGEIAVAARAVAEPVQRNEAVLRICRHGELS
ncbi:hypothetical protein SAMN06265338_1284 [Rhodoblastus acidophilus]|uniref:Uncharacterized protein n=1 Tax=Rhodoblastus acidophilus TaxID=1074 RepID=A0A212SDB9_RHOAC|nr:hypothetical protein SAMN06265338_1284 [Rhodoblastus acidophilus]